MSDTDPRAFSASDRSPHSANDPTVVPGEGVLNCGRTIDQLEEYLDSGRSHDAHIARCAECQQALDSLLRVRRLTAELVQKDAEEAPAETVDRWLTGVMSQLALEVRAGRRIPISHPDERAAISITEGAVRALIRDAGDRVAGIVVGKSTFAGDITTPGASVSVSVSASARHGVNILQAASEVRRAIAADLSVHTDLRVTAIDVTVDDLYGEWSEGQS